MWTVAGASVIGQSHHQAGRGCEDACAWAVSGEVTGLAVADGAGSRPMAALGSRSAVSQAVARVVSAAPDLARLTADQIEVWLRSAMIGVGSHLVDVAATASHPVGDLATTLGLALLTPEFVAIGQIGDTIAIVRQCGTYRALDPAPRYEYANETDFLTAADAADRLRVCVLPAAEVDEVFISTDGLRLKILDDPALSVPYQPFFDDVGAYVRSVPAPAASPAIAALLDRLDDQTGDDKTLVVAVRAAHPVPADGPSVSPEG